MAIENFWGGVKEGAGIVGGYVMGDSDRQPINRYDQEDQERQLQIREQQGQYGALLRQQALGKGPSLFSPALAAAQRAGTAVAASARGANVALAGRSAAQVNARLGMGATELKVKEQLAAQQQYGALLAAQRQADLQARGLGVQLATGKLTSDTTTAQGNAQRGQLGIGAISSFAGGLSDPAAKTNVAPVGSYQQPYGQQPYQPQPGFGTGLSNMGSVLGGGGVYGANRPVGSGVDMKQNIEPIGGVNPRFANQPVGQVGFGAQTVDAGTQQAPPNAAEMNARRQIADWQQEQMDAMAAQDHNRAVSATQIDVELAQGRTGTAIGAYQGLQTPGSPAQQQQQNGLGQGLSNMGAVLGGQQLTGSDPVMKSGEQPVGQLSATAAQVQPYKFQYKPEFAASEGVSTGMRVGAMASKAPGSLADNPIYAPTVQTGPDGMDRVDGGQATMANIAVTADVARKQQLDSSRLDALEQMALQGASGKGARGKRVVAGDVLGGPAQQSAPQPDQSPPPGAQPTGQRYKALTDLGMTQPASYGADLGQEAPGGMRRGLVPDSARAPGVTGRAAPVLRDDYGAEVTGRRDQTVPDTRRQGELQAMAEAGKAPKQFFKPEKALSPESQAQVDLELDSILEQQIAGAVHNISQGADPKKNYAALREALETRMNVKQRRQDRLEQLHGLVPDAQPYMRPTDETVAGELSRRGVKTAPKKVKRRRAEVDL